MQSIEQLLSNVNKLKTLADAQSLKNLVLHLSAEDEEAILVAAWKQNPAGPAPDIRKAFKTFAGYPVEWGAKKIALLEKAPEKTAKKLVAPKAAPAAKTVKGPAVGSLVPLDPAKAAAKPVSASIPAKAAPKKK